MDVEAIIYIDILTGENNNHFSPGRTYNDNMKGVFWNWTSIEPSEFM